MPAEAALQLPGWQTIGIEVSGFVRLLGYELAGEFAPAATLTLDLYWQPLAHTYGDYTVFVHLLRTAESGMQVVASNDRKPCDNSHLTWNWQPRAIIHDTVQLHLPPDLSPAPYELTVGMYDTLTGERLAVQRR